MTTSDPAAGSLPIGKRGQLASAVAAAVDTVAGVRRSAGPGIEVATQFAGGRAVGIGLSDDTVTVHVVAERLPLDRLAEEVRSAALAALRTAGDPRPVAVSVDDLDIESLPGAVG